MSFTATLVGLLLVAYALLASVAWRRPLLARLALREAARRPWQSALLVAGLMTGTAAILAMQVLTDSGIGSEVFAVDRAWGRVDLEVTRGGGLFSSDVAGALAADAGVKSKLSGVQAGVELAGSVADLGRDTVAPLVQVIGFDPASQAPFGAYILAGGRRTEGADLPAGSVLLSQSLARSLGARQGDRLRMIAGGRASEVTVAAIAEPQGPGAYRQRPAVFAPLATLGALAPTGQINVVRLSAPGQGQAEVDQAHTAMAAVRTALAGTAIAGLSAKEVKADDLRVAGQNSGSGRGFLVGLALVVVVAGTLPIVNLMLAMTEERRPRLAVLRALGLTRSGQVWLSVLEGSIYALAAGLVAIAPGVVLGSVLVNRVPTDWNNRAPDAPWQVSLAADSLITAIAAGTLITLVTVGLASFRGSRMSISAAIKALPDRPWQGQSARLTLLAGGCLALGGLVGVLVPFLTSRLLGGTALILAVAAISRGRIPTRPLAALAGLACAIWASFRLVQPSADTLDGTLSGLAGTLIATLGVATASAAGLRLLEPLLGAAGSGRLQARLRPPLAYLTRRPVRAGLGIASIGLVLGYLTFYQALPASNAADIQRSGGSYDLAVVAPAQSDIALPPAVAQRFATQLAIASRSYVGAVRSLSGGSNRSDTQPQTYLGLYALADAEVLAPVLGLTSRDLRYSTDAAVWRALAADPSLVLTSSVSNHNPGDQLWLQSPAGEVRYRVAARFASPFLNGLVGSTTAMAPFSSLPAGETLLAQAVAGADAEQLARLVQRAVFDQGAQVVTRRQATEQLVAINQAFADDVDLIFTIGLLVGVTSLGILALRAIIERRRTIGMLRALGFQPGDILAGVLLEALLIAVGGCVVGTGFGLVIGHYYGAAQHWSIYAIDWPAVVRVLILIIGAVVLVTVGPALQASRLAPADALRLQD